MSYYVFFGLFWGIQRDEEMAIAKVRHMMGFLGSHLWTNCDNLMLSHTFHFENNCPWGICSCAVCVVLDKVPSRGLSFAWHSLLGVGVSRHVMKSTCFTLLDVPHYIHFVEELLCHLTLDESINHVESRTKKSAFVFICEVWNRSWLYVSNIFEPVSFVFCAASFILRLDSFMFRPNLSVLKEFSSFQSFSIALLECLI